MVGAGCAAAGAGAACPRRDETRDLDRDGAATCDLRPASWPEPEPARRAQVLKVKRVPCQGLNAQARRVTTDVSPLSTATGLDPHKAVYTTGYHKLIKLKLSSSTLTQHGTT